MNFSWVNDSLDNHSCKNNLSSADNYFPNTLFTSNCLRHGIPFSILLAIIFSTVFFIGLLDNCVVIYSIVCKRRLRREAKNLFIFNLSLADLFVVLFCIPTTLIGNLLKAWALGDFVCIATAYIKGASIFVSAYSLVAISLDRYCAVFNPTNPAHGFTKIQAKIIIFVIWIAALFTAFHCILSTHVTYSETEGSLSFCKQDLYTNNASLDIVYFVAFTVFLKCIFPILILVFTISHVSHAMETYHGLDRWSTQFLDAHKRKTSATLSMLTCLSITFCICWLPLHVIILVRKVLGESEHSEIKSPISYAFTFAQLLSLCKSCVNPLLYGIFDKSIQNIFATIIQSNCRRRRRRGRFSWDSGSEVADDESSDMAIISGSGSNRVPRGDSISLTNLSYYPGRRRSSLPGTYETSVL